MINKLSKELAEKTENERKKLFADMLAAQVMHIDCTNARVNGESAYVFVNATSDGKVYYSASTRKVCHMNRIDICKNIIQSIKEYITTPEKDWNLIVRKIIYSNRAKYLRFLATIKIRNGVD